MDIELGFPREIQVSAFFVYNNASYWAVESDLIYGGRLSDCIGFSFVFNFAFISCWFFYVYAAAVNCLALIYDFNLRLKSAINNQNQDKICTELTIKRSQIQLYGLHWNRHQLTSNLKLPTKTLSLMNLLILLSSSE